MSGNPIVDLLLVRLSREEERNKVAELLVSEMGMTEEEARSSVESSPTILGQGMEMGQARILQQKLYPYVDILPRSYGPEHPPTPVRRELPPQEESGEGEPEFDHGFDPEESMSWQQAGREASPGEWEAESERAAERSGGPEDDSFVITSASEELRTSERCHVCGRIPTDVEKLAPCRTCGDLTCSDCFDRILHVCTKCAGEGKMVDRPLQGVPEYKRDLLPDEEEEELPPEPEPERKGRKVSPVLIGVLLLVAAAAAFFLLDPLELMAPGGEEPELASPEDLAVMADTAQAADTTEVAPADDTTGNGAQPDTIALPEDSLQAESDTLTVPDTLAVAEGPERPLSEIVLVDSLRPDEIVMPRMLMSSPLDQIEVMADSLPLLAYPMASISSSVGLSIDAFTLGRTEGGDVLLVLSIMHPEPMEKRAQLLSRLAGALEGTAVDQITLYYRETQYHEVSLFTFVADSFGVMSMSPSPASIQRRQAALAGVYDLVSGPVQEWMTTLE